MKRLITDMPFIIAVFLFSGCGNANIFSWTHPEGKNASPEALLADAEKALEDGDYDEAKAHYEKILESDSDNSEALYGLASTELKDAGLSIEDILPKVINEDTSGVEDLIKNLDFTKLQQGTEAAIESLEKIAKGQGDGTISADDVDVNLNLAVAKVVHIASKLVNETGVDIKDDFTVVGVPNISAGQKAEAVQEITEAIEYLNTATNSAGVDVDVQEIKKGFEDFKLQLQ